MNFDELSPELKEKAKACKTTEELGELVRSEGVELSADELERLAGGMRCADFFCPLHECERHCRLAL